MNKNLHKSSWIILCIMLLSLLVSCFSEPSSQEGDISEETREYTLEEKEKISRIPPFSEDCSILSPVDAGKSPAEENVILAFHDKTKISDDKFGFRKKIVFDKPAILSQYMEENLFFFYYGLYRDKQLTKPVIEVNTKYNIKAFAQMEEGASESEFPEYKEGYTIKVDPGTYYLGVYTKEPDLTEGISYKCESAPYQEEIFLHPGETGRYTLLNTSDSVLCRIVPASGKIKVTTGAYAGTLQLLDNAKNRISDVIIPAENSPVSAEFSTKPGETYYIKVQHSVLHINSYTGIAMWPICYRNIQ